MHITDWMNLSCFVVEFVHHAVANLYAECARTTKAAIPIVLPACGLYDKTSSSMLKLIEQHLLLAFGGITEVSAKVDNLVIVTNSDAAKSNKAMLRHFAAITPDNVFVMNQLCVMHQVSLCA